MQLEPPLKGGSAWPSPVWRLLATFSWQELRRHGLRHSVAILAVMMGVALAFSIHLINASALSEFDAAVRSVNGQADLSLRAARGSLDEALYPRLARHPDVKGVSPMIDVQTLVAGKPLRILGVDSLRSRTMTPALMPQVSKDVIGNDRLTLFDPRAVFLNAQAQRALEVVPGSEIKVQAGLHELTLRVAGTVAAGGEALGVMDIAGAQTAFGMLGQVSRMDVQLKEGRQPQAWLAAVQLPGGIQSETPEGTSQQAANVSRAYRVNLTVLALIALFTGVFLVFSTLSLSVSRRERQFALLGVLGLSAKERLTLVLMESAAMGLAGSVLGIALGTALATLTLKLLGGDLGGDYFPASAPALQWSMSAALVYGGLGVVAAIWGGVLPARMAQRLAPAQALKGATQAERSGKALWIGPLLIIVGALLTRLPPVDGVPVWAFVAIACLMTGGIECVPGAVSLVLGVLMRILPRSMWRRHAGALLSLERVRRMRQAATVAIAGIVASLGLSVALTVMVTSFKGSISSWLDTLLPADLYVRTGSANQGNDALHLEPALVEAIGHVPGVSQLMGVRVSRLNLRTDRSPVVLIARPLAKSSADARLSLPLIGLEHAIAAGQTAVYVSEAVVALYGVQPGGRLDLPLKAGQAPVPTWIKGVWRDYAHQQGAIVIDDADYRRITGDQTINDLALWLAPSTSIQQVQEHIRQAASDSQLDGGLLSFSEPRDIRQSTMRVFDRSFAVTYWLQAVALGMGVFGVSASFSAQVLARRKEFGLLSHLGFTRDQILRVLAGEGAVLTAIGALLGLALGLGVSVVLVHVVNPQSFHWTMDLRLPWSRLGLMCLVMVIAGAFTARMAGRAAVSDDVVRAVKEDW